MFRKTLVAGLAIALGVAASAGFAWSQQTASPPPAAPGRAAAAPAKPDKAAPVVAVTGGRTSGGVFGDLAIYRGIPFAAAPVGDLRWRAPQPVKPWTGVRPGLEFGGTCTASEDCLYVNVYKPADAKPGAKLPVMVWIYGGAFTGGSSNMYEGPNFARKGIIYVSINYRLGRAGWFAHPAITKNAPAGEAIGNYGLMDQIAALKWVQRNITAFGGDPRRVTAFGESAGGISVNYLMITPQARGLFSQAISESGFGRHELAPLAESERVGAENLAGKGITGDSAATLKAMRALTFAQLNEGRLGLGAAGPINDGKLLTMSLEQGFAAGRAMKIPYMLGGNSNEASLFGTPNPQARLAALRPQTNGFGPYDAVGAGDPTRTINAMVTDFYITEPDRALARIHAKAGNAVYRYYFSYTAPTARGSNGLSHGAEIGYVFGRSNANAEDAATSQAAHAYWAAFAKYGNPGAAGGVAWPRYDLTTEQALDFSVTGPVVRNQFNRARLDWMEQNRVKVADSTAAGGGTAPGVTNAGPARAATPPAAAAPAAPARAGRGN